ncbi:hypothetical protein C8R47DRAFT_1204050, partial [Mycena vitilis]
MDESVSHGSLYHSRSGLPQLPASKILHFEDVGARASVMDERGFQEATRSVSYARCGDAAAAVSSAARSCNVPGRPVPSMHRKARTYPPPRIRVFGPTRRHPARISLRFALLALRTVTPGLKLSGQGLPVSPATIRTAVRERPAQLPAVRPRCAMSVVDLRGVFLLVVADDAESHLMAVFPMRKGEVIILWCSAALRRVLHPRWVSSEPRRHRAAALTASTANAGTLHLTATLVSLVCRGAAAK